MSGADDFDREMDKREEEEEQREDAALALESFKTLVRARSCIFFNDEHEEVMHGRIEGLLQELDAVLVRDLRPGRERLRCRVQIPYDNIKYVCHSPKFEACKECAVYKDFKEPEKNEKPEAPSDH